MVTIVISGGVRCPVILMKSIYDEIAELRAALNAVAGEAFKVRVFPILGERLCLRFQQPAEGVSRRHADFIHYMVMDDDHKVENVARGTKTTLIVDRKVGCRELMLKVRPFAREAEVAIPSDVKPKPRLKKKRVKKLKLAAASSKDFSHMGSSENNGYFVFEDHECFISNPLNFKPKVQNKYEPSKKYGLDSDDKLVAYLQGYVFFEKRTPAMLVSLRNRARRWCEDNDIGVITAANIIPGSVAIAMRLSAQEQRAVDFAVRGEMEAANVRERMLHGPPSFWTALRSRHVGLSDWWNHDFNVSG